MLSGVDFSPDQRTDYNELLYRRVTSLIRLHHKGVAITNTYIKYLFYAQDEYARGGLSITNVHNKLFDIGICNFAQCVLE